MHFLQFRRGSKTAPPQNEDAIFGTAFADKERHHNTGLGSNRNCAQHVRRWLPLVLLMLVVPTAAQTAAQQKYPDVTNAKVRSSGSNRFDFDVTLSSPYDTAQRYADAFRVKGRDGVVYGERILWHDHADEQPFTRDLYGVTIPPGVQHVVIQGRDKRFGYGGKSVELVLPGQ